MATDTFERSVVAGYGLSAPTVEDVHAAVLRTLGADAAVVWEHLRGAAADGTVQQLIAVMCASPDRMVALLGRSQQVRLACYERLRAAAAER